MKDSERVKVINGLPNKNEAAIFNVQQTGKCLFFIVRYTNRLKYVRKDLIAIIDSHRLYFEISRLLSSQLRRRKLETDHQAIKRGSH